MLDLYGIVISKTYKTNTTQWRLGYRYQDIQENDYACPGRIVFGLCSAVFNAYRLVFELFQGCVWFMQSWDQSIQGCVFGPNTLVFGVYRAVFGICRAVFVICNVIFGACRLVFGLCKVVKAVCLIHTGLCLVFTGLCLVVQAVCLVHAMLHLVTTWLCLAYA